MHHTFRPLLAVSVTVAVFAIHFNTVAADCSSTSDITQFDDYNVGSYGMDAILLDDGVTKLGVHVNYGSSDWRIRRVGATVADTSEIVVTTDSNLSGDNVNAFKLTDGTPAFIFHAAANSNNTLYYAVADSTAGLSWTVKPMVAGVDVGYRTTPMATVVRASGHVGIVYADTNRHLHYVQSETSPPGAVWTSTEIHSDTSQSPDSSSPIAATEVDGRVLVAFTSHSRRVTVGAGEGSPMTWSFDARHYSSNFQFAPYCIGMTITPRPGTTTGVVLTFTPTRTRDAEVMYSSDAGATWTDPTAPASLTDRGGFLPVTTGSGVCSGDWIGFAVSGSTSYTEGFAILPANSDTWLTTELSCFGYQGADKLVPLHLPNGNLGIFATGGGLRYLYYQEITLGPITTVDYNTTGTTGVTNTYTPIIRAELPPTITSSTAGSVTSVTVSGTPQVGTESCAIAMTSVSGSSCQYYTTLHNLVDTCGSKFSYADSGFELQSRLALDSGATLTGTSVTVPPLVRASNTNASVDLVSFDLSGDALTMSLTAVLTYPTEFGMASGAGAPTASHSGGLTTTITAPSETTFVTVECGARNDTTCQGRYNVAVVGTASQGVDGTLTLGFTYSDSAPGNAVPATFNLTLPPTDMSFWQFPVSATPSPTASPSSSPSTSPSPSPSPSRTASPSMTRSPTASPSRTPSPVNPDSDSLPEPVRVQLAVSIEGGDFESYSTSTEAEKIAFEEAVKHDLAAALGGISTDIIFIDRVYAGSIKVDALVLDETASVVLPDDPAASVATASFTNVETTVSSAGWCASTPCSLSTSATTRGDGGTGDGPPVLILAGIGVAVIAFVVGAIVFKKSSSAKKTHSVEYPPKASGNKPQTTGQHAV